MREEHGTSMRNLQVRLTSLPRCTGRCPVEDVSQHRKAEQERLRVGSPGGGGPPEAAGISPEQWPG